MPVFNESSLFRGKTIKHQAKSMDLAILPINSCTNLDVSLPFSARMTLKMLTLAEWGLVSTKYDRICIKLARAALS